jgi:hypothetical protein
MLDERKTWELRIIQSLDHKEILENVLAEAWVSKIFTEEEMKVIVKESKVYQEDNKNKIECVTNMAKNIGGTAAFVMLNFIKQYPLMETDPDGYFYIDRRSTAKNCNIDNGTLVTIINLLVDRGIILKKVYKGISIKLCWGMIAEISEEKRENKDES